MILFKPFPWQQTEWQRLGLRHQNCKLPHALLLTGPAGMGKKQFALGLAELLLCQQPQETACGFCTACQLLQAGTHPDLLHLSPEADGKAIRIEQVRELIDTLSTTAQQGNYQVAIIEPAEAMNAFAVNALLKTIEEPPGPVVIILVSHQPRTLLATLRSRCQTAIFKIPSKTVSLAWLAQQLPGTEQQSLEALLALAEGIPLKALALAQAQGLAKQQQLLEQLVQLQQNQLSLVQWVAGFNQEEIEALLMDISKTVLDIVRIKNQVPVYLLTQLQHYTILQQLSCRWSLPQLFAFFDKSLALQRTRKENNNLNWQLALEDLLNRTLLPASL